ncbi:MAG TPA: hypothetical protein VOA87_16040 [Thermoanaerobaculia bacterium]|nr:hypothetical protein [Thermoanaerobaculia bacterium]
MATADGIMAQVYVAFGQGTGDFTVPEDATQVLHDRYFDKITADVISQWEATYAVQVLERIRAIGRMAAAQASANGDTEISAALVTTAAERVEETSSTELCGPPPP